jgi:hypothetical protein
MPEEAAARAPKAAGRQEAPVIPESAAEARPQGVPAPEAQSAQPAVSELANKYTAERAARGELGVVTPWGEVYSPEEMRLRGLRMGPEEISQHISNLMQNAGGDPVLQGAAVAAEEARLRQRSNQLSRAAMDNPGSKAAQLAQDNAFKDLTDFQNGPLAKLKNQWATQGRGLQGSVPVDLSTFNGMREKWIRDTGRPVPEGIEPQLKETAGKVSRANADYNDASQRQSDAIEKAARGRKLPTPDELRTKAATIMEIEPCRI